MPPPDRLARVREQRHRLVAVCAVAEQDGRHIDLPGDKHPLSEALIDCRARLKQERINLYFQEVADEMRRIADNKIDYDYLKTKEFSDLLEYIVNKVILNRSRIKQEHFKNLLMQAVKGTRPPDMSKVFIDILSEITEEEILLYSKLYNIHRKGQLLREQGDAVDLAIRFTRDNINKLEMDYQNYLLMIQRLIRKGVLYDESLGRYNGEPYSAIFLNELGVRFYEYITRT